MLSKVVMALFVGLMPCMFFGLTIATRFGKLSAPEVMKYFGSHKIKMLIVFSIAFAWPVLIYHWSFGAGDTLMEYVLAMVLGAAAMVVGGLFAERKSKNESGLAGRSSRAGY